MINITQKPVLLVFGMTYNQIPLIQKGQEIGYHVIAIGKGGGVCDVIADEWFSIDTSDKETVLRLAKEKQVKAMITCGTSTPICTIAYVNEKLNISDKTISYETALNATYKNRFRKIIPELLPKGIESSDSRYAYKVMKNIEPPYVLKPADGGGGKGITVIYSNNEDEFKTAFEYALNYSYNSTVIAEQFIIGKIIGVESLTIDGKVNALVIPDKTVTPPPRCITLGLTMPTNLTKEIQDRVLEINQKAISTLGIKWGPTHIDMAIDKNGVPYIIDIGPRLAGGPVWAELLSRMYDYDFYKAAIELSAGIMPLNIPQRTNETYFSERFVISKETGKLENIKLPKKEMLAECNILSYRQLVKNGTMLKANDNDGDRICMFTAHGNSYDDLNSSQDLFESSINIEVVR